MRRIDRIATADCRTKAAFYFCHELPPREHNEKPSGSGHVQEVTTNFTSHHWFMPLAYRTLGSLHIPECLPAIYRQILSPLQGERTNRIEVLTFSGTIDQQKTFPRILKSAGRHRTILNVCEIAHSISSCAENKHQWRNGYLKRTIHKTQDEFEQNVSQDLKLTN